MIIFFLIKETKFINLISPKKKKEKKNDFELQCQMHPSFISWGLILGEPKRERNSSPKLLVDIK